MLKYLTLLAIGCSLLFAWSAAHAAPLYSGQKSLIPFADSLYYLGSTTPNIAWKGLYVDEVCLTGDICRTTWPGGSGSGGLASSTPWTPGFLASIVDNSTLTGVATNALTATGPLSLSQAISIIGSAASALSIADAAADGATKGAASFLAADFNATSGNISLDYTNGQAASGSTKGFLTSTDWTTFNGKESVLTFSSPLSRAVNTIGITANGIGNTELAFDTGQALTSVSSPTFAGLTLSGLSDGCVQAASGVLTSTGSACGAGGGGITAIGAAGQTADGPTVTLATSTSAFNGLTPTLVITGSGDTQTFTSSLSGTLNNAGLTNSTVSFGGVTLSLGGSDASPAFNLVDSTGLPLTTGISGILPIANGGTNNSSAYTAGSVVFSIGTSLTQDNANFFWDNSNKFLGLGTTTPAKKLTVSGPSQQVFISDSNAASDTTTTNGAFLSAEDGNFYIGGMNSIGSAIYRFTFNMPSGRLALGTTTATYQLENRASSANTTLTSAVAVANAIFNTNTTDGSFSSLVFGTLDTNGASIESSKIVGIHTSHTPSAVTGDIAFLTRSAGTPGERMRLLSNGRLGIGTTSPYALLSIGGTTSGVAFGADMLSGYTGNILELKVASSTVMSVNQAGTPTFASMTSALLLTNGSGVVAEYAGTSCTNQFVRSLDALGAATCATVANTDLANSTISGVALGGTLGALTATDTTLTFSGSYTGATARTVGLNLGNANTWTAAQTFNIGSGAPGILTNSLVGIGTTTPKWALQVASSTGPQVALSDGTATSNHWTQRSISGSFYLATSSPSTFATSTVAALAIDLNAIVTTIKQVVRDYISIGTDGVRLSGVDGVLTMLGIGNGNDENLTWDFDNGTANSVVVETGTGVNLLSFAAALINLAVPDEVYGAGWNGSLQVPTKNAVYDKIQASSPANALTLIPLSPIPFDDGSDAAASTALSVNTTAYVGQIIVTAPITVNKLTIRTGATITVAGTVDIVIYSEDGQTQLISVTTASLAVADTIYSTAVSAVALPAGIYYVLVVPNSTTNVGVNFWQSQPNSPFSATAGLGEDVTSEPVIQGTLTVTASTPPTTFDPTAIIGATQLRTLVLRLDN